MNITRGHVRCLSENHLAADESKRCAKDAAEHRHQQQLDPLGPQTSSRRYSCPPRSVLGPSTDDDDPRTETRLTATSGDRRRPTEESQEMSILLSAVENLLHNLLVRSVSLTESKRNKRVCVRYVVRGVCARYDQALSEHSKIKGNGITLPV